jgi:dUTP pyrophosphatase
MPLYHSEHGYKLERKHTTDAGYDMCNSGETVVVMRNYPQVISTGIRVFLSPGTYGQVRARSGLAFNFDMDILAGVIDCGYSGEILVKVINHGRKPLTIEKGMRFCQLIILKLELEEIKQVDRELYEKAVENVIRGENGFGSTGLNPSKEPLSNSDMLSDSDEETSPINDVLSDDEENFAYRSVSSENLAELTNGGC